MTRPTHLDDAPPKAQVAASGRPIVQWTMRISRRLQAELTVIARPRRQREHPTIGFRTIIPANPFLNSIQ